MFNQPSVIRFGPSNCSDHVSGVTLRRSVFVARLVGVPGAAPSETSLVRHSLCESASDDAGARCSFVRSTIAMVVELDAFRLRHNIITGISSQFCYKTVGTGKLPCLFAGLA